MICNKNLMMSILLLLIYGCSDEIKKSPQQQDINIDSLSMAQLNTLATKTIYFAHQSVGANIVDGIEDLIQKNKSLKLNIIETSLLEKIKAGDFAHSKIGKNRYPDSKISEFATLMNKGLANKVDIAFLKLCYIDFNSATDVNKLFNQYQKTFKKLQEKYPQTIFLHLTAPLTVDPTGFKYYTRKLKNFIKTLLGKTNTDANSVRAKYNALIRQQYQGKQRLFDLAKIESTYADGQRRIDSHDIESLIPEFSNDGRHLGKYGRQVVAKQLISFLIELDNKKANIH